MVGKPEDEMSALIESFIRGEISDADVVEQLNAPDLTTGEPTISRNRQRERVKIIASALGSVRAEGLEPSDESKAYEGAYIRGEISADEVLDELIKRYRDGAKP